MDRFDALDGYRSDFLEPSKLLSLVLSLSVVDKCSMNLAKHDEIVQLLDLHEDGVVTCDEDVRFAQFQTIKYFLTSAVDGRQVSRAGQPAPYAAPAGGSVGQRVSAAIDDAALRWGLRRGVI